MAEVTAEESVATAPEKPEGGIPHHSDDFSTKSFYEPGFNSMSMMNLLYLDPAKYGWTACGGILPILEPHEMARRPEAKERFLKQQKEAAEAKSKSEEIKEKESETNAEMKRDGDNKEGFGGAQGENSTIANSDGVQNAMGDKPPDKSKSENAAPATPKTTKTDSATLETRSSARRSKEKSEPESLPKNATAEMKIEATDPTADTSANVDAKISDEKEEGKDSNTKKISITAMKDGVLDIYTYHRGRVGEEPRDEKTGELLCDMVPMDTNHSWRPPNTVVKIQIKFPVGDPSDDEEESPDGVESVKKEEATANESKQEECETRASRQRPTRSQSQNVATTNLMRSNKQPSEKQVPYFVDVIEWDMGDPRTPTPVEYAADIASNWGLNFSQTMDLSESIQSQLDYYAHQNAQFYPPMLLRDPYGNERPVAHFGPPTICALGPRVAGAGGGGGGVRRVVNRSNSGGRGSGSRGGTSSTPKPARARPMGAIKPDKGTITVIPKDQVPVHEKGNQYKAEVLKRAKEKSQCLVAEMLAEKKPVMWLTHNDVCHICHNRKAVGLTFHCGKHNYCDMHCASRLSFRANSYNPQDPTNLPIDFCPICTLTCVCAKCTRRLDDVTNKLKAQCNNQSCGPDQVDMDIFELCSGYSRLPSGAKGGATPTPFKKRAPPKKIKADQSDETTTEKPLKRSRSDAENDEEHSSPSRSTRSSHHIGLDQGAGSSLHQQRPTKKRKLDMDTPTSVKKVPPSEFPKEMHNLLDVDPSDPQDLKKVFTQEGPFTLGSDDPILTRRNQSYQKVIVIDPIVPSHFDSCLKCDKPNDLLLCSICPRAFHAQCIEKSDLSTEPKKSDSWQCGHCKQDNEILPSEEMPNPNGGIDIESKYEEFKNSDFHFNILLLHFMLNIVKKLKEYDYGNIFAEPVNCDVVTDYLNVIQKPMDYGTIIANLEEGFYSKTVTTNNKEMSPMEQVLLFALCDIDQVHHNCLLYNPAKSNYYRAGAVHAKKWEAYYNKYLSERLSPTVREKLAEFRNECLLEREKEAQQNRTPLSFQVPGVNPKSKAVSVLDPDTNMIVKQYTSKKSALDAAIILKKTGYDCEFKFLNPQTVKNFLGTSSSQPSSLLFGYRWIATEDLLAGNFAPSTAQPSSIDSTSPLYQGNDGFFQEDDLTSPTTPNILIMKEDTQSGAQIRGFESEKAAFEDWLKTRSISLNSESGDGDIGDFKKNFLDGGKALDGIVWKRVQTKKTKSSSKSTKTQGKVVSEQVFAESLGNSKDGTN